MQASNTWLSDLDAEQGSDAVIARIVELLPRRDRWCVEFGAWDGKLASNSRRLILSHGYSAVLIEGDEEKFRELRKTYADQKQVFTFNQFVGFTAADGLDAILARTPIPHDFDFLSIDIDGNDYHAWSAVARYEPKVVCVEFNPTIPPEVAFVQPADPALNQGSSVAALVDLGRRKGYELIAVIGVNAFFVIQEVYAGFNIADNRIESLWTSRDWVTYIFSGYDGQVFLRGRRELPWLGIPLSEPRMQAIPAWVRQYPYSRRKRILYLALTNPLSLIPKIIRELKKAFRSRSR